MESDKYVTLFSNTSQEQYNTNSFSKFRNKFIVPLKLEGDWKVRLLDISFPFNPINVPEQKIGFLIRVNQLTKTLDANDTSGIEAEVDLYFDSTTSPRDSVENGETQPKIVNKYRSGTLKGGFYSSVGELAYEITNLFNSLFADLKERNVLAAGLCMEYDQATNQAKVYLNSLEEQATGNVENEEEKTNEQDISIIKIICKNAYLLETILGFDNVSKIEGRDGDEFCLEVSPEELFSSTPCNLKLIHKIYICTDLIDHQIVGSKSLRLLASCVLPSKGNYHMISPAPRYHSIVSGYDSVRNFDAVEIELFSNIQNLEYFPSPLNPSDTDFVECTLHFKRSSLLHSFPI